MDDNKTPGGEKRNQPKLSPETLKTIRLTKTEDTRRALDKAAREHTSGTYAEELEPLKGIIDEGVTLRKDYEAARKPIDDESSEASKAHAKTFGDAQKEIDEAYAAEKKALKKVRSAKQEVLDKARKKEAEELDELVKANKKKTDEIFKGYSEEREELAKTYKEKAATLKEKLTTEGVYGITVNGLACVGLPAEAVLRRMMVNKGLPQPFQRQLDRSMLDLKLKVDHVGDIQEAVDEFLNGNFVNSVESSDDDE